MSRSTLLRRVGDLPAVDRLSAPQLGNRILVHVHSDVRRVLLRLTKPARRRQRRLCRCRLDPTR